MWNRLYYVEDVKRGQWMADGVRAELSTTVVEDGLSVRIRLPQDPGQAGVDHAEQRSQVICSAPRDIPKKIP